MKTFPTQQYMEAAYDDFDTLIQEDLGIPGFDAQRVYEWSNDSYLVGSTEDQEEDEALTQLLVFFAETHVAMRQAEQEEWKAMLRGRPGYDEKADVYEPEPFMILDRQLETYRDNHDLPSFDAFLRALAERKSIPEGQYLISVSW